jgi:hypothetical protein
MRGQQLTLASHGVQPPSVADLEGLLLGPGQLARIGGTARLSVVVGEPWRQAELLAAFTGRGLPADTGGTVDGHLVVRTPFAAGLHGAAGRWVRGAVKAVPAGFVLDGPRLRMWAVAAGRKDGHGYTLALGPNDDPQVWSAAGAVLAAAGLPGTFLKPRADGPAYRVVGRRRLARLAELVGEPPPGAADWPT